MTRGKHASAASGRSLERALERIAALEAAADEERRTWHAERERLTSELQNLRGDFSKKVKDASAAAVLQAQEVGQQEVAAERLRGDERLRAALRYLFEKVEMGWRVKPGGPAPLSEFADLCGISYGELLTYDPKVSATREIRRSTNRKANFAAEVRRGDPR